MLSKKHSREPEMPITSQLQLVNISPMANDSMGLSRPSLLRCKNWSEREEGRLVGELRKGLGRQIVDRDVLASNLRNIAQCTCHVVTLC